MQAMSSAVEGSSAGWESARTWAGELIKSRARRNHSASPMTTGRHNGSKSGHALATISGPMPATSPSVISKRGNSRVAVIDLHRLLGGDAHFLLQMALGYVGHLLVQRAAVRVHRHHGGKLLDAQLPHPFGAAELLPKNVLAAPNTTCGNLSPPPP